MQHVWQRLPDTIREFIRTEEYDARQKNLSEPYTKKEVINLHWDPVEKYLIA